MRKIIGTLIAAAALAASTGAAQAAETITYSYDARGRLVQIARTGTVNNGVTTSHQYDKADNRTVKTTTGSANPGPP
ncbi:MAG TPA: hypothetical protein VF662_00375 [Allosphingosinicella sp.]|jgi:hypothetical protein